jgi:hypothetical protein
MPCWAATPATGGLRAIAPGDAQQIGTPANGRTGHFGNIDQLRAVDQEHPATKSFSLTLQIELLHTSTDRSGPTHTLALVWIGLRRLQNRSFGALWTAAGRPTWTRLLPRQGGSWTYDRGDRVTIGDCR